MKESNALFLLEAIGELSEETVAAAHHPDSRPEGRKPLHLLRRPAVLVAAAIVLIVGLTTAALFVGVKSVPRMSVTVDAVYSVELVLNNDGKILSCSSPSERGEEVVGNLGILMCRADEGVKSVVGAMLDCGDLNKDNNTVLLTAYGGFGEGDLTRAAQEAFVEHGMDGAILTQRLDREEKDALHKAHRALVSGGKEHLIGLLTDSAEDLDKHYLQELSVNDLHLLALSRGISLDGIIVTGESSPCAVSRDEAVRAAQYHMNDSGRHIVVDSVCLSVNRTGLYYRVLIREGDLEYVFAVDAQLSDVLDVSIRTLRDETPDPTAQPASPSGGYVIPGGTIFPGSTSVPTPTTPPVSSESIQERATLSSSTEAPPPQSAMPHSGDYLYGPIRYDEAEGNTVVYYNEVGNAVYYLDGDYAYHQIVLMTSMDQLKAFCRDLGIRYGDEYLMTVHDSDRLPNDDYSYDFDTWALMAVVSPVIDNKSAKVQRITRSQNTLYPVCALDTPNANMPHNSLDKAEDILVNVTTYRIGKDFIKAISSID